MEKKVLLDQKHSSHIMNLMNLILLFEKSIVELGWEKNHNGDSEPKKNEVASVQLDSIWRTTRKVRNFDVPEEKASLSNCQSQSMYVNGITNKYSVEVGEDGVLQFLFFRISQ